eukprot:GHUV01025020.1.p3 GENE.GHUV01025020.1~~GHUV01025020.1.p3  ORF type:complete len:100 (+),score=21.60 GHUV01025020.1:848-1147(+)
MPLSAADTQLSAADGKNTTSSGARQRLLLCGAAATAFRSAICCAKPLERPGEPSQWTDSSPKRSCTLYRMQSEQQKVVKCLMVSAARQPIKAVSAAARP